MKSYLPSPPNTPLIVEHIEVFSLWLVLIGCDMEAIYQ